ncbi:ferric reductase-like transmembrane domain-containing protein [Paenibacillus doosanensis]|uniref:Ferric reductase like transmembrane component n=1 Tax=Paenibacillus konkukensis TaxID=2020716 RepID=A0ABY4RK72_9BACL|nr:MULTISPECIES: ferric reductase-like transmembrane domain-containing protein [Paenibacillus]MCS7461585.1 ferric reductase-like transmembrane domain-containing protein [Paenibacillus doosanensis]UQZ82009.1 Ferric reductase like transmembrane component [Paenibacillus konkukensis]
MAEWIAAWPSWQIIRTLGVIAYMLLAAGICLGIAYSFPIWSGKRKAALYKLHMYVTSTAMILGLLHGSITVIDAYAPFQWREVLVPFTARSSPMLTGIGSLSEYGLLLVIFTSDFRHKLKKKLWRWIHLLSYPIFVMSFVHGYFLGTDTASTGIRWMYLLTIMAVIAVTLTRFLAFPKQGESMSSKRKWAS